MMEMFDLKPCPFCNGTAKLYADDGVRVICVDCGATSKIRVDYYDGVDIKTNAVKSVIDAWNKRAEVNKHENQT